MALLTWEERFARLQERVAAAEKLAKDAMEYAERTSRLHHGAICRLNELAGRGHQWPPKRP